MFCTRKISNNVFWVGANDRRLALFENLFPIPRGVSYNSYFILDDKTALIDTVDSSVSRQYYENIAHVLGDRALDYLVINHMEPDHCANIEELIRRYPNLTLVANEKVMQLIDQFYELNLEYQIHLVKEGDYLTLGTHTLQFIMAPMVHWPEVMMTYEAKEGILFSADAFGTFGALPGSIFQDEINFDRDWLSDSRRYYTNIVGKYGLQVQSVLKKAASFNINIICPLHGPVWRSHLDELLCNYQKWSRYEPEEQAVAIFYGSMYGNTQNAADFLAISLAESGITNLSVYDISNTHISYLIAEAFRCSHLVFACPTYNNGLFPLMETLLLDMKALNLQNRTIGLIENGSWGPQTTKMMQSHFHGMKNMRVLENSVTIHSTLKESQESELLLLRDELLQSL